MSATGKLIQLVAERGGRLYVAEGGKVKVAAPRPLPADLVERLKAHRDELAVELAAAQFNPERLQREADRRNDEARHKGLTDRWCACGRLATYAYRGHQRELWRCLDCAPIKRRA